MAKYGTIIWLTVLACAALFLIIPDTRIIFSEATKAHPFLMGFCKFAILSIMGEFLAARLVTGKWQQVKGLLPKMAVWGVLGVMIVLMFSLFTSGVAGLLDKGFLPAGEGFTASLLKAFYISTFMNLTFGPVFMAAHRVTDGLIDSRSAGKAKSVTEVISETDWSSFLKFVVGKTIPMFWIPAHTITFLLPEEFKVIFAASLSIVLGLILSYAKMKK